MKTTQKGLMLRQWSPPEDFCPRLPLIASHLFQIGSPGLDGRTHEDASLHTAAIFQEKVFVPADPTGARMCQ